MVMVIPKTAPIKTTIPFDAMTIIKPIVTHKAIFFAVFIFSGSPAAVTNRNPDIIYIITAIEREIVNIQLIIAPIITKMLFDCKGFWMQTCPGGQVWPKTKKGNSNNKIIKMYLLFEDQSIMIFSSFNFFFEIKL